jgi:hypothetical protein
MWWTINGFLAVDWSYLQKRKLITTAVYFKNVVSTLLFVVL